MNKVVDSKSRVFVALALTLLVSAFFILFMLLLEIFSDGHDRLSWQFLTSFPSRNPADAGIVSALVGSLYLIILTAIIAIPLGIGSAIYLEKYSSENWFSKLMEVNIGTLAGVPSIIYGLLGLSIFVRVLNLDRSLLAGAGTLAMLVLPIIIVTTREAIRVIPTSIPMGAYALGATRFQVIKTLIFPLSFPGILSGIILAISRALGETAPLVAIGALTYIAFLPESLMSPFTALPIQIFNWISRPQTAFHANAAAGIIVLLSMTLLLNGLSMMARNFLYKKYVTQN